MALVVPILLLITALICQVALALNCYLVVTGCSREGARKAAETNDIEAARKAALDSAGGLPGDRPQVDVTFKEGRAKGAPVIVSVAYRMPLLLPGLDRFMGTPVFRSSTTMCLERAR